MTQRLVLLKETVNTSLCCGHAQVIHNVLQTTFERTVCTPNEPKSEQKSLIQMFKKRKV